MPRCDPHAIVRKWQRYREREKTFRAVEKAGMSKRYVLDMFPYPSGEGLHVGHPEVYTATDMWCRFQRMRGFNVLHPMGYDAFGLPAEQYAIQTGTHPRVSTERNIHNIRRQIKRLGFSDDCDREFSTTDLEYVKWTQRSAEDDTESSMFQQRAQPERVPAIGLLDPDQLDADDLTERLRGSGALPSGRVTGVTPGERRTTIVSTILPLSVAYSADAPADAPRSLILKTHRTGLSVGLATVGEREVAFYRDAAPLMPRGPFPRCYDAMYSDGRFHLVLEDLSETHTILTEWPLPPDDEACGRIVDTWAAFHAFWWRHPRLGRDIGAFADAAMVAKAAAEYRERYARFAASLGDRLWPDARAIYAKALATIEWRGDPGRLYTTYTLAHGDAHVWNLFYPRPGTDDGIRIIDWDAWRIRRAVDDLAYMMAVHWYPAQRARLEATLLERYHQALCAGGVRDYDLDRLREDYRYGVIASLAIPVWQMTVGLHTSIWWPHVNRLVSAFNDLDCSALLDRAR
jgi:hypothetical protein